MTVVIEEPTGDDIVVIPGGTETIVVTSPGSAGLIVVNSLENIPEGTPPGTVVVVSAAAPS